MNTLSSFETRLIFVHLDLARDNIRDGFPTLGMDQIEKARNILLRVAICDVEVEPVAELKTAGQPTEKGTLV